MWAAARAAVAAAAMSALLAAPAHAKVPVGKGGVSGSSVCSGSATSTDDAGTTVGTASGAPGSSAVEGAPFVVSTSGKVSYSGSISRVLGKGSYTVRVQGVTVRSETFNNKKTKSRADSINIKSAIPFAIKGPKVWGSFNAAGNKATCTGGIWVKFHGSPVGTVPWIVGVLATILGLAGVATSLPKVKP